MTEQPTAHVPGAADSGPGETTWLDVEEILAAAKLPERSAWICMRADLEDDYETAAEELSTLVTPLGEIIEDGPDRSLADTTPAARAEELAANMTRLRDQMKDSRRRVMFRALSSDALATFNAEHLDRNGEPKYGMTAYHDALIAATAVKPRMTVAQMQAMRGKLADRSITELVQTATWVCTRSGVDLPKLPGFLPGLTPR